VGFEPSRNERRRRELRDALEARSNRRPNESEGFGEGGIRTRHDPLDSVSCRFYIAAVAVIASDAAAPCTRLHPHPSVVAQNDAACSTCFSSRSARQMHNSPRTASVVSPRNRRIESPQHLRARSASIGGTVPERSEVVFANGHRMTAVWLEQRLKLRSILRGTHFGWRRPSPISHEALAATRTPIGRTNNNVTPCTSPRIATLRAS
jgi:hypothetical protein